MNRLLGSLRFLTLAGCAALFPSIALLSLVWPHQVAAAYGFELTSADAFNQFRAVVLGFWCGLGVLFGLAARRPDVPLLAFVGGAAITLQAVARFASVALDGMPHWRFLAAAVGELGTGVFLVAVSRRV